jgi:hypothetical protein
MGTDPQDRMRATVARREAARLQAQAEAVADRMVGPCCRDGSVERHRLLLAAAITEQRAGGAIPITYGLQMKRGNPRKS